VYDIVDEMTVTLMVMGISVLGMEIILGIYNVKLVHFYFRETSFCFYMLPFIFFLLLLALLSI